MKRTKLTPLPKIADEINSKVLKIENELPVGHRLRGELHWVAIKAEHLEGRDNPLLEKPPS